MRRHTHDTLRIDTGATRPKTGCGTSYTATIAVANRSLFSAAKPALSAAMSFAGAHAIVYRHNDPGTLRVHIDRPMGSYFWSWLATVTEAISLTEERILRAAK